MLFLLGEDLLQKLETEKLLRTLATDHINSIQSLLSILFSNLWNLLNGWGGKKRKKTYFHIGEKCHS